MSPGYCRQPPPCETTSWPPLNSGAHPNPQNTVPRGYTSTGRRPRRRLSETTSSLVHSSLERPDPYRTSPRGKPLPHDCPCRLRAGRPAKRKHSLSCCKPLWLDRTNRSRPVEPAVGSTRIPGFAAREPAVLEAQEFRRCPPTAPRHNAPSSGPVCAL